MSQSDPSYSVQIVSNDPEETKIITRKTTIVHETVTPHQNSENEISQDYGEKNYKGCTVVGEEESCKHSSSSESCNRDFNYGENNSAVAVYNLETLPAFIPQPRNTITKEGIDNDLEYRCDEATNDDQDLTPTLSSTMCEVETPSTVIETLYTKENFTEKPISVTSISTNTNTSTKSPSIVSSSSNTSSTATDNSNFPLLMDMNPSSQIKSSSDSDCQSIISTSSNTITVTIRNSNSPISTSVISNSPIMSPTNMNTSTESAKKINHVDQNSPISSSVVYPPDKSTCNKEVNSAEVTNDFLSDIEKQVIMDGKMPSYPSLSDNTSDLGDSGSEREVIVRSRYSNFLNSTIAQALIRSASMEESMKRLSEGAYLWKIRGIGKFYNRQFKIDKDSMCLVAESKKWWSPGGLTASLASDGAETSVPIIEIVEIREGWKSDTFNKISDYIEKMKEKGMPTNFDPEIEEGLCFSVIHGNSGHEVLDLMANSKEERDIWVNGLRFLMESVQSLHQDRVYDVWLRKKFEAADKDHNGALNYEEVVKLIKNLNLKLDKNNAKNLFNAANTSKRKRDGDQVLDSQEFVAFYNSLLKMTEIEAIYEKYSNNETKVIGQEELLSFIRKEQGLENYQLNQVTSLIQEFELSYLKENNNLSFDGFYHLLLSDTFDIYNTTHVKNIYQDMTQPLAHYYISSSHNTYLTGHQLAGESSVEGYISALKKGCRVVELDVWNGEDGEPIIYHGHTLTTKITFADVLRDAIKLYAFTASPYPVILSIENHLNLEQQVVMVKLLKEILGDSLLTDPVPKDLKVLPSPMDLKHKIIVKAKKPQGVEIEDDDEEDDQETIDFIDSDDGGAASKKFTFTRLFGSFRKSSRESFSQEKHHKPMVPELAEVVNVCEGKKFVSFGTSFESDKCVHFPSLRENKAKSLFESSPDEFIKFTERQISKIYPLGTRTDSSNLKPYPFWSVGAQVVTLNMQTADKATFYNTAFFKRNNNCGYVLKPDILVNKERFNYDNPPAELGKVLRVRIISGQHLPPSEKKNDIVDPYIQMKVRGHPMDKQKQKTKVVKNNGFNPVWNEELVANIRLADVALIYFTVRDESSYAKDPVLALACIPFTSLGIGYRHVHLTDITGKSISPAAIFVHVSIKDN